MTSYILGKNSASRRTSPETFFPARRQQRFLIFLHQDRHERIMKASKKINSPTDTMSVENFLLVVTFNGNGLLTNVFDDDEDESTYSDSESSQSIDTEPEDPNMCLNCQMRPNNVCMVPCWHIPLCSECWETYDERDKCPKCNEAITTENRVFF